MTVTAGFKHAVPEQERSRRDQIPQIRCVAVTLGELRVIRFLPFVVRIRHLPHSIPDHFRQLHAGPFPVPERRKVALIDLVVIHRGLLPLHPILQHLHRRGVLKPLHRSLQTALRIREHQGKEQKPAGFYNTPVADIFVGLKILHQPLLMPLHALLCLFEESFIHSAAPGYLRQRAEPDLPADPGLQRPPRSSGAFFHRRIPSDPVVQQPHTVGCILLIFRQPVSLGEIEQKPVPVELPYKLRVPPRNQIPVNLVSKVHRLPCPLHIPPEIK